MSEDRLSVHLTDAHQAHPEVLRLWHWCKAQLKAGKTMTMEARPARRSLDQNAKFHAICHDLESLGVEWQGKKRSAGSWKVLLISGHAIATKQEAEIVEGLEGELVSIRESSAEMSRARGASLIEYAQAFLAQCEGVSA